MDHAVLMIGGAMGGSFLANIEETIRWAVEDEFFAALRSAPAITPRLRDISAASSRSAARLAWKRLPRLVSSR